MKREVLRRMVEDVERDTGECCGFFFGYEVAGFRMITKSSAVVNCWAGNQSQNFEIAPGDYLRAEEMAEHERLSLLGVYHSHPGHAAIPSEFDLEAAWPYFSYIIFSVIDRRCAGVRSWRLDSELNFKEESIDFTG